ncbi:TetR/AcrR family transcriptional regulator [Gracilibacillus sp. S3-1-1]|uniref:TetR/AcrR family transcriptional regulator n=1 Tax=Gracilibacillus pellucidus TaxID=3095368 RepID=A0ACC6M3V5_9BACI|nr:TetR/AcrR family transcriptional regulator [Gracilibacillus sp. S3-1-1]MDX8045563.1 TetR/AcrR family transcriptional regulator [Gracilibacillus sp. S3-1-1]
MIRKRLTHAERKQETRKILLESAAETFAKLGFHGASVDKIAEYAGFTKGAIYTHFKSKEELFLALLEQQIQSHLNTIHQIIDEEKSYEHFIEKMGHYFDLDKQNNQAWSILNMEFLLYAMRDESVRQKWTQVILGSVDHISKVIKKMRLDDEQGVELSAEELAWTILSLENGMGIFHFIAGSKVPNNLYGKALQNILQPTRNQDSQL